MIIGSVSENRNIEKRVAVTPDIVKKYLSLGLKVHLSEGYASHLGITDDEYVSEGAIIFKDENEILSNSSIILQLSIPDDGNLKKLQKDQILVGVLNPHLHEEKLIDIIGLNYKDNHLKAKKFLDDLKSPYKIILKDLDGTIAIEWGAYGVPETFLIHNKKIVKKIIGPLNENSILEIKEIIK